MTMIVESALLPIAVAAAGTVAGKVVDGLAQGLSFARLLSSGQDSNAPATATQAAHSPASMAPTGNGWRAQRSALRQNVEKLRDLLQATLSSRFAAQGIDLSQPAVLAMDTSGRVVEVGQHMDRARIEQIFESDPALANMLRSLLRQADMLEKDISTDSMRGSESQARLVVDSRQAVLQVA